ncbi:MAG: type II/IV secretion system protein [Alphaproteobacteria bacterium]|nr:type II/IV secretion system protein [Alphaproteobacteria bacterium]
MRLGERLIEKGLINNEQLNIALREKKTSGKLLGEVMVDLNFVTEDVLTQVLAEASGYEVFDLKTTIFDGDALKLLKKEDAKRYNALPISIAETVITIAVSDPFNIVSIDTLKRLMPRGNTMRLLVASPAVLAEAIDAAYGYASDVHAILKELDDDGSEAEFAPLGDNETYTHPIVRLVNAMLNEAVKMGASDLHFEPEENFVRVRYRLDGVLFTAQMINRRYWSAMSQRIKVISSLNIADKISPQDGRMSMQLGSKQVDFRVSSLPTVWGENIVMRILDKSQAIVNLNSLGYSQHNVEIFKRAQLRPEGIVIVTGPTGSGKTTTLYALLNTINSVDVNIQTLEDPVEYSIPMIRQTSIREGILDFADGIRSLMRQDPDIILVGEVRDTETAEMALKASMTGHQVYTTLHTNDSFGAIPRLVDLGLKPGMMAGAIIAVAAQRLVRKLCMYCREETEMTAEQAEMFGDLSLVGKKVYKGHEGGCDMCKKQGYRGRVAVAEILLFDDDLDEIMARNGTKVEMRRAAKQKGFKSMKDDGLIKILEGVTSVQALQDVVNLDRD